MLGKMFKKTVFANIIAMVSVFMLLNMCSQAYVTEVSDPGRVNKILEEFQTPVIKPSEEGVLSFNLRNPYDAEMRDIRLRIDIYGFGDLDEEKDITRIDSPPTFKVTGTTSYSFTTDVIHSDSSFPVELYITTDRRTEKGVYFVRFELEFVYENMGESSIMRSRGHFSDEEWSEATRRPGVGDDPYYSGSINITHLGVNGIIPDTSFSVKTPIPRWPQYMLGGLAAFFGIFAVMLYMQEEYNSFPWLEKVLNQWAGKFDQFRRRFKDRSR